MLNVAQIGVGYWGPNLLRNLLGNNHCRVSIVADISSERRHYVQRIHAGIRVTDNAEEIFQNSKIDAVVVATPVSTHFDFAMKALNTGKHVLVEKPLARTVKEVEEIGNLARQKNLVVMAGHTFIYNAAVRYVRKLIDGGDLGRIRYIYSQRLNLGRIRTDVDALWNFAPHDISIIQYWLGDPDPISIVRRGVDYIQDNIDDVVFLNILYPDKIMANIHVSWLDPLRVRTMVVVGTKKMVVYDDAAENKIAIYDKGIDRMAVLGQNMDFDNGHFKAFNHRSGDVLLPKIDFVEPLRVEIDHFVDCIENGTECRTGVDHAMKVVHILERASCQL